MGTEGLFSTVLTGNRLDALTKAFLFAHTNGIIVLKRVFQQFFLGFWSCPIRPSLGGLQGSDLLCSSGCNAARIPCASQTTVKAGEVVVDRREALVTCVPAKRLH